MKTNKHIEVILGKIRLVKNKVLLEVTIRNKNKVITKEVKIFSLG